MSCKCNVAGDGGNKSARIAQNEANIAFLLGTGAFTEKTDPAVDAITVADVDDYRGCSFILTAAGNSQTLPNPTDTTVWFYFTVINRSSSTDNITVNGIILEPGESARFIWDLVSWAKEDDSGIWINDGTDVFTQDPSLNIDLQTGILKDNDVTSGIALGDASNTTLSGLFSATSILGASNELKGYPCNAPAYAATITVTDNQMSSVWQIDSSGGDVAVTIPDVSAANDGQWIRLYKDTFDDNIITIETTTGQQLSGTTSEIMTAGGKGFTLYAHNASGGYKLIQDNRFGISTGGTFSFFLSDTVSDIGGYLTMYSEDTGGVESSVSSGALGVGSAQLIEEWSTESGVPGLTSLQAGIYNVHFHASKTGVKTAVVFFRLYKRVLAGTETLLMTFENSNTITTKAAFSVDGVLTAEATLLATDRLVLKSYATIGGTGTDADVTLYMEGETVSRLSVPVSSAQLDTRYLVKSAFASTQTVISPVAFSSALAVNGGLKDADAVTPIALANAANPTYNTTDKTIVGSTNEVLSNIPHAVENVYAPTLGQTVFTLSSAPSGAAAFSLYLNGQLRLRGTDYTQTGTTLTWLDPSGLTLLTTDELIARYNDTALTIPGTKTIFFQVEGDANLGSHRVQAIGATGAFRFEFKVPADFSSLIELTLIGIISAGAAGSGKDIDLASDYGTFGELYNEHSETDTGIVYDFTGLTDRITELDISSVFSSLAACDVCGVFVDHKGIGGTIYYAMIKMRYQAL